VLGRPEVNGELDSRAVVVVVDVVGDVGVGVVGVGGVVGGVVVGLGKSSAELEGVN
jgi:hypothetical protein